MQRIKIGTWIETERTIQRGTSYAADYINHLSVAGEYDAYLTYESVWRDNDEGKRELVGATAKDIVVTIDTNITDGKLFSGFGGNNFSSSDVTPKPSTITLNPYSYHARDMVNKGNLVLDPGFEWLADPIDLNFKAYLEQKDVGLHRHLGLDPYWHVKSRDFAERLKKVVDAVNDGTEWSGWDVSTLETAKDFNYVYFSNDPKVILTFHGKQLIEKYTAQEK